MLLESLSSCQKKFFSDRFNLTLNFSPNGGIRGKLHPFSGLCTISREISGLYSTMDSNIAISFMCDFTDPNLTGTTLICFSGEIIKYDNDRECLIIRWLMNQDLLSYEVTDRDIEILLDDRHSDPKGETVKVRAHISKHALEIII